MTADDASTPEAWRQDIRAAHVQFLGQVQPFTGELHRYARGLTGCAFAAEDLCQEAIVRTFVRLGQGGDQPRHLRAYLFRVATNLWHNECRRRGMLSLAEAEERLEEESPVPTVEVEEALERLVSGLPPRERAAVLLKDVFDFSLEEIADAFEVSVGAVKSALHRGRRGLGDAAPIRSPGPERDPALIDALVSAFQARDVDALLGLMRGDAEVDLLGVLRSRRAGDRELVISKTLEDPDLIRVDSRSYRGETIILLWHRGEPEVLGEILRVETDDRRIVRTRWYYFCPHTLRDVARDLGVECRTHGYHGV